MLYPAPGADDNASGVAVMLEAIRTMHELALTTEACLSEYGYLQKIPFHTDNVVTEAIADSVAGMVNKLKAAAVVSLTESGFTSRLISKHRPECPILAVTHEEQVARRLTMNWGVEPVVYEGELDDDARIRYAIDVIKNKGYAVAGDCLIVTAGHNQRSGGTNLVRVITL